MQILRIPKGNGKFRVIYAPNKKEKQFLRECLPQLHALHAQSIETQGTRGVAHGFVLNRNAVTCALPHRGYPVTISCDLESWFDTVTEQHLLDAGMDAELARNITLLDEHGVRYCRQGLPTSPVAANLAATVMDARILACLRTLCGEQSFVYTRYADDLTVSFRDPQQAEAVLDILRTEAQRMRWTIAEHKTHVQHAKAGRRIIVGIAVDERVLPTRAARRKLRAAQYRAAWHPPKSLPPKKSKAKCVRKARQSAAGLAEWVACKLPRKARSSRQMTGVLAGGGGSSATPTETRQHAIALSGSGRRVLITKPQTADDSAGQ